MDYKSFHSNALEQFKVLPEESGELYKRYFVTLPLAKMAQMLEGRKNKHDANLGEIVEKTSKALRINFDAVFSSEGHMVSGKYVTVTSDEELDADFLDKKMFKNNEDKLVAFIHAFGSRIIKISIPKKTDANINLMFFNTDVPMPIQVVVDIGAESSVNLIEYYASDTKQTSLLGIMHEMRIGKHASVETNFIHNEDYNTIGIGLEKVEIEEGAELNANFIYSGSKATRSRNRFEVIGHAAQCSVNEILLSSEEQKYDIATNIINGAQDTNMVLESRAALMDKSTCLLKGSAFIKSNASGSRSYVNERGIMLDKETHIDSIPSMSIENNNVKATHSSSTAPIDQETLFYLMSRGASEKEAKKLLVHGFIGSNIARIESPIAKLIVASILNEKVSNRKFGNIPELNMESMWLAANVQKSSSIFKGHYKYRGV